MKFDSLSTRKYRYRNTNKDSWFRNLSDLQISSDVVDIVSLGPNYSVPQKISKQDVIDTIKNVESSLLSLDINSDLKNEIREKVTNNIMHNFNKDANISMEDRNFANKLKVTKQFLKNNPDIFFTNADKGNLTVCLKKSTYNTKMTDLLSNTSTYISITRNPLKKLQSSTSNILKRLNDNEFLKYKFHNNQLTLTNTVLTKCYDLPKIHKQHTPLRPIISLINSPTHFLAKILYDELKDSIKVPKSHLNDSLDLKRKLEDLIVDDNHVLLSLDVNSLFTNVPCDLVLKSLDRRCQLIHNNCRIPFDEIINCTKFHKIRTYNSPLRFNKIIKLTFWTCH